MIGRSAVSLCAAASMAVASSACGWVVGLGERKPLDESGDNAAAGLDGGSKAAAADPDASSVELPDTSGPSETSASPADPTFLVGNGGIYAALPNDDLIFEYGGRPGAWTAIGPKSRGFAVQQLVVGDDTLYALAAGGVYVFSYSSAANSWQPIRDASFAGPPFDRLVSGGATLFARASGTTDPWRHVGSLSEWVHAGGPGDQYVAMGPALFGLPDDHTEVWTDDGTGNWHSIYSGVHLDSIQVAANDVFGVQTDGGAIARYSGTASDWDVVSERAIDLAATEDGTFYKVDAAGVIWSSPRSPLAWRRIGEGAARIYANRNAVYAYRPAAHDLFVYGGTPPAWEPLRFAGSK